MAEHRINASFQQRRDTAANWESKNPVLLDGEMITVITNAGAVRHKTGDGTKTYTQLPFDDEPLYNALAGKCDASISVETTLLASAWSNGQQTVSVTGLKANQNGIAALSQDCTSEEYDALVAAELYISGQGANSLSFTANGEIPNINIPITVILLG